jgi:hypothetical protein
VYGHTVEIVGQVARDLARIWYQHVNAYVTHYSTYRLPIEQTFTLLLMHYYSTID